MPVYSTMTITFLTDYAIGQTFSVLTTLPNVYYGEFVATRSGANEITVGTPTANPGEVSATNYETAFDLDNPAGYITTRTVNALLIESETLGEDFEGILQGIGLIGGTMSVVFNNYVVPPDVSTIDFALTRSPHYINIPFIFNTTTKATISLFIWDGDLTAVPATATYTLTKVRPSIDYAEFNSDISDEIRADLNPIPNINTTSPTQVLDGSTNGAKWVKYSVVYTDPVNIIADIEGTFSAVDGFGYYADGVNPGKPANDVLTSVAYRKVDRNAPILFPFINDTTITSIDIDSDLGTINATETITSSLESTDFTQYICVDTSLALTDEYITIKTLPAADEFVYELIDECKYNPKTIYFKNRYGKYDQLTMFKKSKTTMKVDSDMFVNNYISGGTYDSTVHQFKKINIQAKESIELNSGYITESENELYKQLLLSDKSFFYENSLFVPVNVVNKSIEYKTRVNDSLIKYTLEFEYAYNTIQNV